MSLANPTTQCAIVTILHNLQYLHALKKQRDYSEAKLHLTPASLKKKPKRKSPVVWVRYMNEPRRRLLYGHWDNLIAHLREKDPDHYFNYMRMTPQLFDEILERILPAIQKKATNCREPLEAGLKLAVTIRHLATGCLYPELAFNFRVSRFTISKFVPQVCDAIVDAFAPEVMACPTDQAGWLEIAEEFYRRWNVPHACGALDGKHIALRKPPKSGSLYYNYKQYFSIVLLALVDADYKFIWGDVGGIGHQSDAQLFNDSELKECLDDGYLNFPDPAPMPHDNEDMPYFLIGDDAFALRPNMMKPYAIRGLTRWHRIFNYRISRARRVVENAFGILAQRFRFLLCDAYQFPKNVQKLTKAAMVLHNLLRIRNPTPLPVDTEDADGNRIDGALRQEVVIREIPQPALGDNYATQEAKRVRETLRLYFNSSGGKVPWQHRMIDP